MISSFILVILALIASFMFAKGKGVSLIGEYMILSKEEREQVDIDGFTKHVSKVFLFLAIVQAIVPVLRIIGLDGIYYLPVVVNIFSLYIIITQLGLKKFYK